MEELNRARFNFPVKVATVTTIIMILVAIAVGYVVMYYLRDLNLVTDVEAKQHINNTTDQYVIVAGVITFVVIISVLFYIFKVFPKD